MTDRNQNKYLIEKVLHEWIRDLPEVRKVAMMYERGYLTAEGALNEIVHILEEMRG